MGKEISLFSGYSQQENRTTNYCLLILKMLYEENPKFLAEVLSLLIGENIGHYIGVKFRQQEKRKYSIPDGLILQKACTIYMETKNYDWFYDAQLKRHLQALNAESVGIKILIALGKFESTENRFERIKSICKEKYRDSIFFAQLSFEDFIQALEGLEQLPKNLSDPISDFRDYLNEHQLLTTWVRWLDVVNCAVLPEEVLEGNVYICPAEGGSYTHSRCKYFGMYRNKCVEGIALIEAIIDLLSEDRQKLKWKNVKTSEEELIDRARKMHNKYRLGKYPLRVFVVGEMHKTNFFKDTKYGMWGTKKYFDVSSLNPESASDLAKKLDGIPWSQLSG